MKAADILFTENASNELGSMLDKEAYHKIAVLVDENTFAHCYPLIKDVIPSHTLIQIKSGEVNKTLATCSHIWKKLTEAHFDRKSIFINLGGGVIGDMGGFCASTFKRGLDFINIPTTLLAQVDASVGGKLGIDFNGLKNHIGLFKEPLAIIIDQGFLKTLPGNELRSGFAEVIKHHLIADNQGWAKLNSLDFNELPWTELVPHSVKIKSEIVKADPLENGRRKSLNFGHTLGHAIESYLLNNNRAILHGEAVAIGMICESYISYQRSLISRSDHQAIEKYILKIYDKVVLDKTDITQIGDYLSQDKKNYNDTIMAALLNKPGSAVWDKEINLREAYEAILYYENL